MKSSKILNRQRTTKGANNGAGAKKKNDDLDPEKGESYIEKNMKDQN